MRSKRLIGAVVSLAMGVATLGTMATPAGATTSGPLTYGGDGYAIKISGLKVLGLAVPDTTISEVGPLPSTGGTVKGGVGVINLPGGLGTITVTDGQIDGVGGIVSGKETIAGVSLLNVTGGVLNILNGLNLGGVLNGLLGNGSLLGGLLGGGTNTGTSGGTSGGLLGGVTGLLGGILGGSSTSTTVPSGTGGNTTGLLDGLLGNGLVQVGLLHASAKTDTAGNHLEASDIGGLSVAGLQVPLKTNPNSIIDLGLAKITLNKQSYDSVSNTSSATAVELNLPANGLLSLVLQGTISIASMTVNTSGGLCASSITSISPNRGVTAGGTPVTITGTGFLNQGTPTITFGAVPATNVVVVNDNTITAVTPANGAGVALVSANFPTCATNSVKYGYQLGPQRLGGVDRMATSIIISQNAFPGSQSVGGLVLAGGKSFADALVAVPLARQYKGPLLLSGWDTNLDPRTLAEIQRVLHPGGTIAIVGGTQSIGENVRLQLQQLGYGVTRFAGPNAAATAVSVAANGLGNPGAVFEATSLTFPDSLSAGSAAALEGAAILFTNGTTQAPETATYLAQHPGVQRYTVGGPAAAADPAGTIHAFVGADRYETARQVAEFFVNTASATGIARADTFPDAMTGGAHIAALGGAVLLVPGAPAAALGLPVPTTTYITNKLSAIKGMYIYGGNLAVADVTFQSLAALPAQLLDQALATL